MGKDELAAFALEALRRGSVESIDAMGEAAKGLRNRRNANLFWRAGIERAGEDGSLGRPNPLGALAALARWGALPLDQPLDNGELPLSALAARAPALAAPAVAELGFDPNAQDGRGRREMALCLARGRSEPWVHAPLALALASHPRFDLKADDQGAQACFKGMAWMALPWAAEDPPNAVAFARSLGAALAAKGYDFNAARETPDVHLGSKINTPLAYCVKTAAKWSAFLPEKAKEIASAAEEVAMVLLDLGADPELQMEAGQRMTLVEACRESLTPRLAALLEGAALKSAAPQPCSRSSRTRL